MEWQFSCVWPDNNMVQFQIGSRAVQSYFGDGCYMSGYDHAVPTQWAYSDIATEVYGKTATFAAMSPSGMTSLITA